VTAWGWDPGGKGGFLVWSGDGERMGQPKGGGGGVSGKIGQTEDEKPSGLEG